VRLEGAGASRPLESKLEAISNVAASGRGA